MSTISTLRDGLWVTGVAALVVFFCAPALAGEIYSWRTEDGGYAYTDDAKAIPARYRDQAQVRTSNGIEGYRRLTAPASGSMDDYSRRLANRLGYLRSLNHDLDLANAQPVYADDVSNIMVKAGGLAVGVPTGGYSDEPVVIETIRYRHNGEMATRHNTVVKKGDRVLTVIKGKPLVSKINQAPEISEMVRD
jgi:hypothetical protein